MTRKTRATRRDFLKLAGTTAPVAALAVAAAPDQAEAAEAEQASGKLQDTAHIRAYYDSARF